MTTHLVSLSTCKAARKCQTSTPSPSRVLTAFAVYKTKRSFTICFRALPLLRETRRTSKKRLRWICEGTFWEWSHVRRAVSTMAGLGSSVRILSVSEKVFYFGLPWADQVQDFSKFDPLHTMPVDSHTIFLVASYGFAVRVVL